MSNTKKLPYYRKIMNHFGIAAGSFGSGEINRLTRDWMYQKLSVEEAIKRLPTTKEFEKWLRFHNDNRVDLSKKSPRINALMVELELPHGTLGRRKMLKVVQKLAKKYNDNQSLISHLKSSKEWRDHEVAKQKSVLNEEIRIQKRKEAHQKKVENYSKLPRNQRLKAWGLIKVLQYNGRRSSITKNVINQIDNYFKELVSNAILAQDEKHLSHMRLLAEEERQRVLIQERIAYDEERKKNRQERIEKLDYEVYLEEAQEYVRENIEFNQLKDFRLWFKKNFDDDISRIKESVEEFNNKHSINLSDDLCFPRAHPSKSEETPHKILVKSNIKRVGKIYGVQSRPDQAAFANAVRDNCSGRCVVTGSGVLRRCEAAHLVEHKNGGLDCYTNGLWLRKDIHALFDAGLCAINPQTMIINFLPRILELDVDLRILDGRKITSPKRAINSSYLVDRWERFTKEIDVPG
ncbi:HNH endonuclease [Serratia sp. CY68758]|uniref:HNH endonuclease n=3 Tax=Serratia TaxID=613 RepID=UPI003F821323